jgi:predicted dinucleotide-binding enzyme
MPINEIVMFGVGEIGGIMAGAFASDPRHQCVGRSEPARMQRALAHTDRPGRELTRLRELQQYLGV